MALGLGPETYPLHRIGGGEAAGDAGGLEHGLGVVLGAVGEDDLASRQALQHGFDPPLEDDAGQQYLQVVGFPQEMVGVDLISPKLGARMCPN